MPNYDVKAGPESGWAGVVLALSALVGAVLTALGVEQAIVTAVVALVATAARPLIGALLPSPAPAVSAPEAVPPPPVPQV